MVGTDPADTLVHSLTWPSRMYSMTLQPQNVIWGDLRRERVMIDPNVVIYFPASQ